MKGAFDPQVAIDLAIQRQNIKNMSGCDVEVYGWRELPSQIKELFNSLDIKYTIIPNKYYSKDFDKDALYIIPKRKTKIKYWEGMFLNED